MEDMKHTKCSDCKHWDGNSEVGNGFYDLGFGLCKAIAIHQNNFGADIPKAMAIATCSSEIIKGELLTKPDFSCRLFEHR